AKQVPHRPSQAPALSLRAGSDGFFIISQTSSRREKHLGTSSWLRNRKRSAAGEHLFTHRLLRKPATRRARRLSAGPQGGEGRRASGIVPGLSAAGTGISRGKGDPR